MAILRKLQIWQEFIGLAKIKPGGMSIIVGFTKMTNFAKLATTRQGGHAGGQYI